VCPKLYFKPFHPTKARPNRKATDLINLTIKTFDLHTYNATRHVHVTIEGSSAFKLKEERTLKCKLTAVFVSFVLRYRVIGPPNFFNLSLLKNL
jgi:hypothetical protein